MATFPDTVSMAIFCDFENVALGVRDANYDKFDIKPILERLLLKGSIVVKKAYCDWDRYKSFKATMHEANFELIEIPHVRQSGKNSADIRLVVDALDLCYTKSHVNTFVIISGDSDFSPLVSKLRENAKQVIGVGVKQSTSDLLVANCDEFIFYDDLVRESRRAAAKRDVREAQPAAKRSPDDEKRRREEMDARRSQAIDIAAETFDALSSERGDSGKIWASVLKEAIKRRKPDFSETFYGFRTFGNLLEEAQKRGLLEFGRDERSGAYVYRSSMGGSAGNVAPSPVAMTESMAAEQSGHAKHTGRHARTHSAPEPAQASDEQPISEHLVIDQPAIADLADAAVRVAMDGDAAEAIAQEPPENPEPRRRTRGARKSTRKKAESAEAPESQTLPGPVVEVPSLLPATSGDGNLSAIETAVAGETETPAKRKAPTRSRRPRKKEAPSE
ncbi:NYN domain-containing protein [Noviherbaspirillum galbum]|uniref:NYN domain-containing protein n=1 Tax=Noviherbaspirillum galbum TaxID=2709383 RepID=A0A6B3SX22_9BURK|nr:NYN domain-containing protein [Noviherbaspirillum galbum]NEX63002.1 NYN domain-containing protein [Noviherbaspirillum galbum]